MSTAPVLAPRLAHLDYSLRSFAHVNKRRWILRDRIMYACGFDRPKRHPVGAYVQFHNSIIRVNHQLKSEGLKIARSEDGAEIYSLISILEAE